MSNFWNKPKSLRDIAEEIANRIDNSNPGGSGAARQNNGREVSNEPRIPKGQSDGGEWTSGGSSRAQRSSGIIARSQGTAGSASPARNPSGRLANSYTPAPFVDDHGKPVLGPDGKPMLRPSDVDPHFFVDQGRAAADFDERGLGPGLMGVAGLANFRQLGPWDIQRIGSDVQPTKPFIDSANVVIGLYGAAAGLPQEVTLQIANQRAKQTSDFGPNANMNSTYPHLRNENVYDIQEGYRLYESGRIGPSTSK